MAPVKQNRFLTVKEAAEILGVTQRRVNALINSGSLKAARFGSRSWIIEEKDLEAVKDRKPGRRPQSGK